MKDIKHLIQTSEYNFLRTNAHLGSNIMLLAPSGSSAYGIEEEFSELKLYGCAMNTASDILGLSVFDHYSDQRTNTVINSFFKTALLLVAGDTKTTEMLCCDQPQYAVMSPLGKQLLANKSLFFSQRTTSAYYGYIKALESFIGDARTRLKLGKQCFEKSILTACEKPIQKFNKAYATGTEDQSVASLYILPSDRQNFDVEVCMDASIKQCPIRDVTALLESLHNVTEAQRKGAAARKLLDKRWLSKKLCTMAVLLLIDCELLETGDMHTNREKDAELLLPIRDGKYILQDCNIDDALYDIINPLMQRLEYAKENTVLPPEPDEKTVNEFVMDMSRKAIRRKRSVEEQTQA